jgi:hypothetical protein
MEATSRALNNLAAVEAVLEGRGAAGAFALQIAPKLGIEQVEEDVLGSVKGAAKALGLGESGWKKLLALPEEHLARLTKRPAPRWGKDPAPDGDANAFEPFGPDEQQKIKLLFKMFNAGAAYNFDSELFAKIVEMVYADKFEQANSVKELGRLLSEAPSKRSVESIQEAEAFIAEARERQSRMPSVTKAFFDRTAKIGSGLALEELHLVVDCLDRIELGVWGMMEKKPTWGQLMAIQAEWHDQQISGSASKLSWEPLVDHLKGADGLTSSELCNGLGLAREGRDMHHCVSGYSAQCHQGLSKIFSIRRGGERLGTLELQRKAGVGAVAVGARANAYGTAPDQKNGLWTVVQFRGLCNAAIGDDQAWEFAREVAGACNAVEATREAEAKAAAAEIASKGGDEALADTVGKLAEKRAAAGVAARLDPGAAPP